MKKWVKNFLVVGIVLCFAFLAIASSSDDERATKVDGENNGNQTSDNNDNNDDGEEAQEGAHYQITYQSASTWKNSIGTVWVQAMFEVTNVGTTELYLSSGAYDLEDSEGNLVSSSRLVSVYPTVIGPGESALYHETTTISDADSEIDVTILPRPSIKRAKIDNVRLEVTEVTFSEGTFSGIQARGRVENTTGEEQSSVTIAIILYDIDDKPIGVLSTTLMEDIASGDKIGFEASALSLPDDITPDRVARYEAFAYPWLQLQW